MGDPADYTKRSRLFELVRSLIVPLVGLVPKEKAFVLVLVLIVLLFFDSISKSFLCHNGTVLP